MSKTGGRSDQQSQTRSVGESRSKRGLYIVIALLALSLFIAGSWLLDQRPAPSSMTPTEAAAKFTEPEADPPSAGTSHPPSQPTSAPMAAEPTAEATQPTTESVAAAPPVDLPIAPVEGARAPDLTLSDLNGEQWTLSELQGKVVLLNFWATW